MYLSTLLLMLNLPLRNAAGLIEPDLARNDGSAFLLDEDVDLVLVIFVDDEEQPLLWFPGSLKLMRRRTSIFEQFC